MSVVIACRNEAATLPACLDAIATQDDRPAEVILVDGGSTDGSREIARSLGVRILHDGGAGAAAARNVGIAAAHGDIIAFTDADCVPRFDWLKRLTAPFEERTVAGVAGGLRLPRATLLGRIEDNDARVRYRGYITSNIAYRAEALRSIGGFDPTLCCAEDYDLAWRLMDSGQRIVHEPAAIVLHTPPELHGRTTSYLRKQFWYARHDVRAHVRAIQRGWRATGPLAGSAAARAGLARALGHSAISAALALGAVAGSSALTLAALGAAGSASLWHVTDNLKRIELDEGEVAAMTVVESAKRIARGAGTLVGLVEAAIDRAALKSEAAAPARIPSAPRPLPS